MLKFFRHIRKSLLEQNKMGKYFKYAIGEILLVVIGILIALQINNWNEKNKSRTKENVILTNFKEDLNSDLVKLEALKKAFQLRVESKKIFESVYQNKAKEPVSLSQAFKNQYVELLIGFSPNTITIDEIKNSSGMAIISSTELRRQLVTLYNTYDIFITKLKIGFTKNQELLDYVSYHFDNVLEPTDSEINKMLNDKYFINQIIANYSYGLLEETVINYNLCMETLNMLEKQLK
ncbi:DUF6090 family protein [Ichthyenterobacterium sp. W332]|uniref:DUF6090 family protein n=1 Tax=Microcosmobacter mediterraneus TaxID=3075607 RepID=A0ABU2YJE4_9FLAO|nr:DUF6090 family protein [Ichthyenterobacterium sp. W332]MDT0558294.1 DUF6090 family protein [Ichthyenterobacterium sp. W332]